MAHVLVTGGNGFIGSHITERLLAEQHHVRVSVRSLAARDSYAHLRRLPHAERLEVVAGDLLRANFAECLEGITHVVHAASPYVVNPKDAWRDLIEPAEKGTLNVLAACAKARVERVVVTSSMAAITDQPDAQHCLTEEDWNTQSTARRNPYYYSKVVAERAAWRFMDEQSPDFSLVVLHPFVTIGPSHTNAVNPSNQILLDIVRGVYPGIMALAWGLGDVRDVADAHVRALFESAASGRYICANEVVSMRNVVAVMKSNMGPCPTMPTRNWESAFATRLLALASWFQPRGTGSYLRTHLGRAPHYSNEKIRRDLHAQFRPAEESIRATLLDLAKWQHLESGLLRAQDT